MASYHVSVNKALTASQQDLIDHKEHCSADLEKLATVGRALGHQLRIKRNDSQYGLYTGPPSSLADPRTTLGTVVEVK